MGQGGISLAFGTDGGGDRIAGKEVTPSATHFSKKKPILSGITLSRALLLQVQRLDGEKAMPGTAYDQRNRILQAYNDGGLLPVPRLAIPRYTISVRIKAGTRRCLRA